MDPESSDGSNNLKGNTWLPSNFYVFLKLSSSKECS